MENKVDDLPKSNFKDMLNRVKENLSNVFSMLTSSEKDSEDSFDALKNSPEDQEIAKELEKHVRKMDMEYAVINNINRTTQYVRRSDEEVKGSNSNKKHITKVDDKEQINDNNKDFEREN